MSQERLPLLSEQQDRLAYAAWTERQGLGEFVRNFGGGFRLRGALDVDALKAALTALVERHEALRTAFPVGFDSDYQVVQAPRAAVLAEQDLRHLPEEGRTEEGLRRAGEYLSRNLDPAGGLMLSTVLVRLGEEDHILGLALDHMVADGASLETLVDELWQFYAAAERGEPSPLPTVRFDYRAYLRWEDDWLRNDPVPRQSIARFAEILEGPGVLPLADIDGRLRDTNERFTPKHVSGTVSGEDYEKFTAYCRKTRVTPFVALLTAYLGAVHACGGSNDLGVMIPISRRTEESHINAVCNLTTQATVRVRFDTSASFTDLNRQVRSAVMETFRLGQVPLYEVLKKLAPETASRLFLRPCLFFDLAPAGWTGGRRAVGNLTAEPVDVPITLRHEELLSVFGSTSEDELSYNLLYPADVYTAEAIDDLNRAFTGLLRRCVNDPLAPVGTLF